MSVREAVNRINQKHQLKLRLTKMDCATVTDPQKWFGRREVVDGETKFFESDFLQACQRGDVILLDEISRPHPHITNELMPMFDGSQSIHLSDLNVTIPIHDETVFIATMNLGVQYGGTYRMDWALRERFPYSYERSFPPHDDEIRVLTSHTGVDKDGASRLVTIAEKTRQMHAQGDLKEGISTRVLVAAAWLVASGMTEAEALTFTAMCLYDPDADGIAGTESERQKVAQLIQGKTGQR
jgi:nitric oxide reductase NorQ protein